MKPTIVNLYEAGVSISVKNGVKVMKRKYKTKFTGKNYICVNDNNDPSVSNLYSRVTPDEILSIRNPSRGGNCPSMSRYVYYLDGQEDEAVKLLRDNVETILTEQCADAQLMLGKWKHRND